MKGNQKSHTDRFLLLLLMMILLLVLNSCGEESNSKPTTSTLISPTSSQTLLPMIDIESTQPFSISTHTPKPSSTPTISPIEEERYITFLEEIAWTLMDQDVEAVRQIETIHIPEIIHAKTLRGTPLVLIPLLDDFL